MGEVKVAIFNLNETERDPRVRRFSETMVRLGYQVKVFELHQRRAAPTTILDGYEIVRVPEPQSYTVDDMQAIERTCSPIGVILSQCGPEVMSNLKITRGRVLWAKVRRAVRQRYRRLRLSTPPQQGRTFNPVTEISAIRSIMLINLGLYNAVQQFAPDIVYCNDLDTLLAGVLCKIQHGQTLLFDAHEIYPEQLAEHMRSDIWYNFYSRLEKKLLPFTDGRLTVCDSLGMYFQKVYRCGPFITLRNTPSIQQLPDASILERHNHPVRILYHGAYVPYRGLDEIIAIADHIDNAIFIFRGIGSYETELRAQVSARQLENRVHFVPSVPIDDLVATASQCDIGLSPFLSVCLNTQYALPNKFFEYMMAGLAVANADLIEMRLLTEQLENGVLFDSLDPESIVKSLNDLVQDRERLTFYRRQSYKAAQTEFHWEHEEEKLKHYLQEFVS